MDKLSSFKCFIMPLLCSAFKHLKENPSRSIHLILTNIISLLSILIFGSFLYGLYFTKKGGFSTTLDFMLTITSILLNHPLLSLFFFSALAIKTYIGILNIRGQNFNLSDLDIIKNPLKYFENLQTQLRQISKPQR